MGGSDGSWVKGVTFWIGQMYHESVGQMGHFLDGSTGHGSVGQMGHFWMGRRVMGQWVTFWIGQMYHELVG